MENNINVAPHPQFLELLFAGRSKLFAIFNDVLGLHGINHIAITRIDNTGEIVCFSSTPALEFNLFKNNLWHFDKTYHPEWFQNCSQSEWSKLYVSERYDELYYVKQIKHQYPLGYSLSAKSDGAFFIYSLASNRSGKATQELFLSHFEDFYRIGEYCSTRLNPFFQASLTK